MARAHHSGVAYTQYSGRVERKVSNLQVGGNDAVCDGCIRDLRIAVEFKSTYVYLKKWLSSSGGSQQRTVASNAVEHFLSQDKDVTTAGDKRNEILCRSCGKFTRSERFTDDYEFREYLTSYRDTLEKYFPEMDVNLTDENVMCGWCFDSLKRYVTFIEKSLANEEKVNPYFLVENVYGQESVGSNDALGAVENVFVKCENPSGNAVTVKTEIDAGAERAENEGHVEPSDLVQSIHVKTEPADFENPVSSQEILWIKSDTYVDDSTSTASYSCEMCIYQTDKDELIKDHCKQHSATVAGSGEKPPRKPTSDVKLFHCHLCVYKSRRKDNMKTHLASHERKSKRELFKCHLCVYQAQYKSMLRKHMVVHTDPSQLKIPNAAMFLANLVGITPSADITRAYVSTFSSFHRRLSSIDRFSYFAIFSRFGLLNVASSLNGHMQKHNEEAYKCGTCDFETKYRKNLERHMMTHKDPAEIPTYKCAICGFEAKRKSHLLTHISLKHRTALEIVKFKCDVCSFEVRLQVGPEQAQQDGARRPSEIPMYSCDQCPFSTKYKDHLPRHMIRHKDPSEVYETGIKGHLQLHADAADLPPPTSAPPAPTTSRRQYLNRHLASHKVPPTQ
ncbi:hypothetical protein NQ318_000079 [Aromia moschata]|uniref:C2H2-type domain-containing protein n=1 Tax=Aromia moschata TaxID=1265417 RepID=A0AAV8YDB9_9CUCU|nr:hypothetical protein NQ318_000079 [Aromia moschata]